MNDLHEMDTQLVQKQVVELSELSESDLETVASGKYGYPVAFAVKPVVFGFRRGFRY